MSDTFLKVDGLDGLEKMLEGVMPREARNLNRATVHALAGIVRDDARRKAPKDDGTLRKAIKSVRRKPRHPDKPFSDVRVTRGRDAKHDAYYWRFVELGTKDNDYPRQPFIAPAVETMRGQVQGVYREEFRKKYEKFLERKAKQKRRR